jgi:spermidine/putrescine-binding protein
MVDAEAEDVDLQFYYPEPTNLYVDAFCIPNCCQNKELAEIFLNYMLEEEPAVANAVFISYAVPNRLVRESEDYVEEMGEDVVELLYPEDLDFAAAYEQYAYRNLSPDLLQYQNELWEQMKIN